MNDKIAHLIVGFAIGIMSFIVYYVISGHYRHSIYAALAMGLCVGGYKEVMDFYGPGTFEWLDFGMTFQGSLMGAIISGGFLYKPKTK